jgi:hypothetical protein
MLLLRYSQRWAKLFVRQLLPLVIDSADVVGPRHCLQARCPCQFIEEHLKYKPSGKLTLKKVFTLPNFD